MAARSYCRAYREGAIAFMVDGCVIAKEREIYIQIHKRLMFRCLRESV